MMTTPLKIGLAAACLVVVAVLIAVDQTRLRKEESPLPTSGTDIPQAVLQPSLPIALPRGGDALICPAVPAAPKPEAAPEKAPVAEKPPAVAPAPPAPPPVKKILLETTATGQRVYTVVPGDTLYGISVKVFNTPRHYERIYETNLEQISDPNTLRIGMKLLMPDVAPEKAGAAVTNQ